MALREGANGLQTRHSVSNNSCSGWFYGLGKECFDTTADSALFYQFDLFARAGTCI